MNISVAIITKDEEKNIGDCIDAAKKQGFEVVVCDTGSKDKTREIAASKADIVCDFKWIDDFSAAKNFCASHTSNEYVLFIDSDEFLQDFEREELFKQIKENPESLGRVKIINKLNDDNSHSETEWLSRICSKKIYRYEGCVHEQLVRIDGAESSFYKTGLSLIHTGYFLDDEKRLKKAERNIALIEKSLKEKGDNAYDYYQLGKAHYMKKDYQKSGEAFEKALDCKDLNEKAEYSLDLVTCYGYSLINSGKAAEAMKLEALLDDFGYSADYLFVMGLIYMQNANFEKAVFCLYEASKIPECMVVGVNSYLAFYNIGVIYECLGNPAKAKKYYEKCGDFDKAKERLKALEG